MRSALKLITTGCLLLLLAHSSHCYAGDSSALNIVGNLIRPACSTLFPLNQTVALPSVSLKTLVAGSSEWSEVPLGFRCAEQTQVKLRFVPADLAYDSMTLRTSLDGLGLQLRLMDANQAATPLALRLNETVAFSVSASGISLSLGARPVMIGSQPPMVGSYQSHLLMVISYL